MTKVNISFRLQPWHYRALKEELEKGKIWGSNLDL